MHRATPANSSFRAYVAGGSRATVPEVDDSKLMQESKGNFMANEAREKIEAPQNYGFTSVVMDADKDKEGKITASAETFVQFMGGNGSFPVFGNMDDRRHRLQKLEKGDTAMFRGRGDKQQFHMTGDGGFWTAPRDKTVRMHLLDEDSEQNESQQQQQSFRADGSARDILDVGTYATTGGQAGSGQKKMGQEAKYKDGQKSHRFVEVTKDNTKMGGTQCHMTLDDKKTYVHAHSDKNVYLGAEAGKATFSLVVTLDGPCVNTKGKIG